MKKVLIYKGFERFWHWTQSVLIIFLAVTGFEIHGSFSFFGFENAVKYHNIAAVILIVLIIFAIFWHFTTGEWRQYLPTFENLRGQINFYLLGIFKGSPHPFKKTTLSKLNPLQRLTYLGLKLLVIPVMVTTGLLYLYYRYPQNTKIEALNIDSLAPIAILHTIGAFLLVAFIIAHLYLITTGESVTSNLNAMITGYENLHDEHNTEERSVNTENISESRV
ncbi:MAG: cytochrome b/b6 domain-containing protein [Ignavibacteriaceae bacterium]|nr:cytochrome b/b6 domain-containing protein [Ignavibacteriaceae bacterium]